MLTVNLNSVKILNKDDQVTILRDIDFLLPDNCAYTILGSNGSGKSTLLKAMTRLLNENLFDVKGKVLFDDKDLLSISGSELDIYRRSKIKIIFQDAANCFDPLRKLKYYFNLSNLEEDFNWDSILQKFLLPGYSELCNKYPYEISIGQAQRLNFALAYATQPQILLLDEPTSALDVINNNFFKYIVEDFITHDNNSVLLVTHDFVFAKEVSTKLAVLKDSTLTEFMGNDQIDSLYHDSQKAYLQGG